MTARAAPARAPKKTAVAEPPAGEIVAREVELVLLGDLRPHPKNYRSHPEDQLEHLRQSLREHGWYRNVLIARDGTILGGHGIVEAAKSLGLREAPAVRLDLDPDEPRALKVLTADNELARLAEVDDRLLSELLKEVKDFDPEGLLGTGYDEAMLANLVMVTRPASEVRDFDEAAEWVGMPDYDAPPVPLKLWVSFATLADKQDFAKRLNVPLGEATKSMWWPWRDREDPSSLRFEGDASDEDDDAPPEPLDLDAIPFSEDADGDA